MKKCKKCSYEMNDGALYCNLCGTKVEEEKNMNEEGEKGEKNKEKQEEYYQYKSPEQIEKEKPVQAVKQPVQAAQYQVQQPEQQVAQYQVQQPEQQAAQYQTYNNVQQQGQPIQRQKYRTVQQYGQPTQRQEHQTYSQQGQPVQYQQHQTVQHQYNNVQNQYQRQNIYQPVSQSDNRKAYCIMSYIGILWLFGLLANPEKMDKRVRFHVGQGIIASIFIGGINILATIITIVINITSTVDYGGIYYSYTVLSNGAIVALTLIWTIVTSVTLFYLLYGIVKVVKNEDVYLPIIGRLSFYK